MSSPESPSAIIISIVVGIFVTVVGGVILAYIMHDGRFAANAQNPQPSPVSTPAPATPAPTLAITPNSFDSSTTTSAANTNSAGEEEEEWTPGSEHPDYPNVIAADKEGVWEPAPGYEWANSGEDDLRVVWAPGKKHSDYPHVVASDTEGRWEPEDGYEWVGAGNGDFRVRRRDE